MVVGKSCLQRVERQGIRAILNQLRDRVAPSEYCGARLLTPISARNQAAFAYMEIRRLPSNGAGALPAFDRNTAFECKAPRLAFRDLTERASHLGKKETLFSPLTRPTSHLELRNILVMAPRTTATPPSPFSKFDDVGSESLVQSHNQPLNITAIWQIRTRERLPLSTLESRGRQRICGTPSVPPVIGTL